MSLSADLILHIAQFIPLLYLPKWAQVCQTLGSTLRPYIQYKINNHTSPYFKRPHKFKSKKWFAQLYLEAGLLVPGKYLQNKKESKFIALTNDKFAYSIGQRDAYRFIIKYAKEKIFSYAICAVDIMWYIKYDREQYYFDNVSPDCHNTCLDPEDIMRGILVHPHNKIAQKFKALEHLLRDYQLDSDLYQIAVTNSNVDALNWLYNYGVGFGDMSWINDCEITKVNMDVFKWLKDKSIPFPTFCFVKCIPKEVLEVLCEWPEFDTLKYISEIIENDNSNEIDELLKCKISLNDKDTADIFLSIIEIERYDLFIWMHQNGAQWPDHLFVHYNKETSKYIKFAFKHGYTIPSDFHCKLITNSLYYKLANYLIETGQIRITPEYTELIYKSNNRPLLYWMRDNNLLQ